jgi:nucleotide-binding universal stress UspA family protein
MKILVALDGSAKDAAVLARVSNLARATGAELLLVHALNPWADPAGATAPFLQDRIEQVRQRWRAYLRRRAKQLAGLSVTTLVEDQQKPDGHASEDPPDCLARVASDYDADLLAVASKRASGMAGLLLGSTAQALLHISPCPVLVVRPGDPAVGRKSTASAAAGPGQAGPSLAA